MFERIPVILDGDPGHDDAIAWLLALASPQLEVLGVTTVDGNASIDKTTYNARRILTLLGATHIPLAQGASRPLAAMAQNAPAVHGESGLDGPVLPEPHPATAPDPRGAVEAMAAWLRAATTPVWLVPTGPLTNVATLLLAHPELKANIAGISLMGGGIRSGNWSPAAEFNILVDPEAAHVVFTSGLPIRMAGLDVTNQATINPDDVVRIRRIGTPLAAVVADWVDFFYEFHAKLGYAGAPLHDPVAVVALTRPDLLETRDLYVEVALDGLHSRGATIGDWHRVTGKAPNARVALNIDRAGYVDLIVDAVERMSVAEETLRLTSLAAQPAGSSGWPTVIDCDPGTDDLAALILAHALPQMDVKAITTVAGNIELEGTTRNALGLVSLLDWDVPVAAGASQPLVRDLVTAADIHGGDGLLGVELPSPRDGALDPRPAWELIRDTALAADRPIDIVAIGPLTNIAIALATYPELPGRIRRIVIMGGGVLAGNTTPAAEFNSLVDPEAALRVLDSGVPCYLASLDVTHQAYLTRAELEHIRDSGSEPAHVFGDVMLRGYDIMAPYSVDGRGVPMHDPVAVAFAADPAAFGATECYITVETRSERFKGMTICNRWSDAVREPTGHLIDAVDRAAFVAQVTNALA